MSDMDEGDTPYANKSCRKCGLVESPSMHWQAESTGTCPGCTAEWPACLEERFPYDGASRPQRRTAADARRDLPDGRHLLIYFDKHWTVSEGASLYGSAMWTEGQAVAFAERCEAQEASPSTLGLAEEQAARRAPALKLVRDNPYKAATLLQDVMDNDETDARYDPDVLVEGLSTREWRSSNVRAIETLLLRAFCEAVVARYTARNVKS